MTTQEELQREGARQKRALEQLIAVREQGDRLRRERAAEIKAQGK